MTTTGFDKVLVANRGEIAVRVMRACEELGLETVAVYSDADRHAGHVRYADEAYNIGPARAADSYLDQEAIVEVAQRAGADAVHPGYGFLAENAAFAALIEDTDGLAWVGPSSDAMGTLGEKTSARSLMDEAGVPIVPGTTEPVADATAVEAFGEEYGYPVAIKAEGGGGGRGMKVVETASEAADQLESAKREGAAYFDNDAVYLERYLENPRHVEVQVLADAHGTVLHLGERDCSLQRRHQKVIEEGPSPALSPALREQIHAAAREGARKAGYTNAGTVEFLVEDDRESGATRLGPEADFYFLEVNTRIQVEHPVTELLTGIDIVKWQLRIAAGEQLPYDQTDIELDGHAIEFRINAENAADEFAPAAGGTLATYDPPGGVGVRMDDALRQGDQLVTDYDSMIAKLLVHGPDRETAIARGRRALGEFELEGVVTIVPFHQLMLTDDRFVAGRHTTKYLDDRLDHDRIKQAYQRRGDTAAATKTGEKAENEDVDVTEREFTVEVDNKRFEVLLEERGTAPRPAAGSDNDDGDGAAGGGRPRRSRSEGSGEDTVSGGHTEVTAEMQGTILEVPAEQGESVAAGDVLCVLEAMKMENDVVADAGGTVTDVAVEAGESVDMGDRLFLLE